MFNVHQNPLLVGDGLGLCKKHESKDINILSRPKRKLLKKIIRNILLFLKP